MLYLYILRLRADLILVRNEPERQTYSQTDQPKGTQTENNKWLKNIFLYVTNIFNHSLPYRPILNKIRLILNILNYKI